MKVDNQLPMYHRIRLDRIERRKEKAVRTLPASEGVPGGALAGEALFSLQTHPTSSILTIPFAIVHPAKDLVYELSEFLSRRYPDTYRVTRHEPRQGDFGWGGEGQVRTVTVVPVGATYDLDVEDPMRVAGLL